MRFSSSSLLAAAAALSVLGTAVQASDEVDYQSLYVPLPEDSLLFDIFDKINGDAESPQTCLISVAISTDDTKIYYDHWEDGYDSGDTMGSSTEIWGDGDASNGCAPVPGRTCTDANDYLNAGDVAVLENAVNVPRVASEIKYDGMDHIRANMPVAMTRAGYPSGPGSLMAGAVEVIEEANWGSSFEAPVGKDTVTSQDAFEFVAMACMASKPGTKIYLDGTLQGTLGQGEGMIIEVNQGQVVTSSEPIQVHLITGDPGSTFELRWYSLTPTDQWSNEYYAPVGDTRGAAKVTLYNPGNSAIDVTCTTLAGSYNIRVPAGTHARSDKIIDGTGAKFESDSTFFAFSSTDTESSSGQIFDWGYPLMTRDQLTNIALIGLGYGCTGNNCDSDGERSVVWITPVSDATVFVDYNNDGTIDDRFQVDALEGLILTDDDEDMSGAIIWATERGTGKNGPGVDIAAAWGQKASLSKSNDQKALDLGTVIVPFEPIRTSCIVELIEDNDNNDEWTPGDLVRQTIVVANAGPTAITNGAIVVDTLDGPRTVEVGARGGSEEIIVDYIIPDGEIVTADCDVIPYEPPPSSAPSETPSGSPTKAPTSAPSKSPTGGPTATPSAAPSKSPTGTPTGTPNATPSATPSVSPSASPSKSPTGGPTATPNATPSATPSSDPTGTPNATPSATPSMTPSVSPSATPSASPSKSPTGLPTLTPSAAPSKLIPDPTSTPSVSPSAPPSVSPSKSPTGLPSATPSVTPSASPSGSPTGLPTPTPSAGPSKLIPDPTSTPSVSPSAPPSASPSKSPTGLPSATPSASPSKLIPDPTSTPSVSPSGTPSVSPSASPSKLVPDPTATPSVSPSATPTESTPVPTRPPVDDKTFTDPPTKGSGSGDPHFKTWLGDKYDYHGECDLVLVDNPSFADGLGLRVHIRTTRVKYFSFIEKVAIQIGMDVLEFDNDVENFMINGTTVGANRKHHKTVLGGFIVRRDKRALSIRLNRLGERYRSKEIAKIDLHTRKNGFPAVIIDGGKTDVFKGSLGLLGQWPHGRKMSRDGKREFTGIDSPLDDATEFALEWQVRDTDPFLFKESRYPQFPTKCTPPADRPKGRLGESLFRKEAEEACSHWKYDMDDCIFDVMATQDVLVAAEGHIVHIE